jgi:uncharacterized RDD family membrane protein YckC
MMAADFDAAEQPELIQCEVTGRWVPADETVVVQGRRVCAEGKQLLLDRLRSGEALPGEFECPTVVRRFGAMLVDGFCLFIGGAILGLVLGALMFQPLAQRRDFEVVRTFRLATLLLGSALQFAYFVLFHGICGQTPGKMAARIRVTFVDGSPLTMKTAFARAFFFIGPAFLIQVLQALVSDPNDLHTGALMSAMAVVVIAGYAIVNILCALCDRSRQRALHDRLTGTRVIVV